MARRRAVSETVRGGGGSVAVDGRAHQQDLITAAAQTVDLRDRKAIKRISATRQDWQAEAWAYYDTVGMVGASNDFIANAIGRMRFFIGWQESPSHLPIEPKPDELPEGMDVAAYDKAIAALDRFSIGQGLTDMARKAAYCLSIPGDLFIVGREEPIPGDPTGRKRERFDAYSSDEVDMPRSGGVVTIRQGGDRESDVKLDPQNSIVFRVWRPHPRRGELAITPMRRLLEPCEELLLLQRYFRSASRTRLNSGILIVDKTWRLGPDDNKDPQHPEGVDKLKDWLLDALISPIDDEGSASGVVPFILHVPGETIANVKHLSFGREFDEIAAKRIEQLRREVAGGIDLPDQVSLGLGDVKYRNAEVITDEQAKLHLEPLTGVWCRSATAGYLTPALEADDVAPDIARQFVIWFDPSGVTADPDQSDSSNYGYENDLLAGRTWRRVNKYTEDDAPDEEELAAKAAARSAAMPAALDPNADPEADPFAEEDPTDDEEASLAASALGLAIAASGGARQRARLGERLQVAEAACRTRLQTAADTAMREAFRRIGAQVRAKPEGRAEARGVSNAGVVAGLGWGRVAALGVDSQKIITEALDGLHDRYDEIVSGHTAKVLRMIGNASGIEPDQSRAKRFAEAQVHGWGEFRSRLESLTADELFLAMVAAGPKRRPSIPVVDWGGAGEFDAAVSIPPGLVRDVLSMIGGQGTPSAKAPDTLAGIAAGPIARDALEDGGLAVERMQWVYGDPGSRTTPFEPHEALDGIEFDSFTDDVLLNDEPWPETSHYFPGDHGFCGCDYAIVVGEAGGGRSD